MDKNSDMMPQYIRIATDIASKTATNQYEVEQKTPGQSTLYSAYGVSQETVCKAVNLLPDMREISVVADVLGAKLGDITDFVAMEKGMTNHSYLFSCKGNRYILRIPGEGTDHLINRTQEADVYRAIAGTGLCDDVTYLNPENGFKVVPFLEGVRICDPFDENDVEKCMALLRRFHGIQLNVGHRFEIFDNIEYYEFLWKGQPSVHQEYEETKENVLSLKSFIEENAAEHCLTHIDAVPDNFLFYQESGEEKLQLTDWEYAGMQDPHVDIAMFCLYSLYDRPQIDRIIDIYFEGKCDNRTRIKIYCYIAACGLLWSNWSEYKQTLGGEFGDYAEHQYRYAQTYYEIAREEIAGL